MYYGFYYDWTYILVLIGMVLSLLASSQVKGTFAKYSKIRSYSGQDEKRQNRSSEEMESMMCR